MLWLRKTSFLFPDSEGVLIKFLLAGAALAYSCSTLAQAGAPLFTTKQDVLFKVKARLPIPDHPESVITYPWMSSLVDYDNNGSIDTILYGHHSGDAYIWRGTTGTAEYLPKGNWVFGSRDPIWMDLDKDGDIDGIGTEGAGIGSEPFLNSGNGTFTKSNIAWWVPTQDLSKISKILVMPSHIKTPVHPLDARPTKLYYVDLNNDGVDEMIVSLTGNIPAVTSGYSGYSWVFEKQGSNWVDATERMGLRDGLEQQLFAEDLDMDGDMDLLDLLKENIYRNDAGVFTKVNTAPIFGGRRPYDGDGEVDVLDIDNNGYRDLIFGGDHSPSWGVYLNTGTLSFQRLEGNVVPVIRRDRKFADLDNDGDIDMVVNGGKEMIVYDNVTPNPGMHVKFTSKDYFGTDIQVKNSQGKMVFNTQIYQYQHPGMSQVYVNSIHVGGVSGEVQVIVNAENAGPGPGPGPGPGSDPGPVVIDGTSRYINNELVISGVRIGDGFYAVEMRTSPVDSNMFTLKKYQYVSPASFDASYQGPRYEGGVLTLPRISTAGSRSYRASLTLWDLNPPVTFLLTEVQPLQ